MGAGLVTFRYTRIGRSGVAGSYLRRIDSCITQLTAQGPCRTCNERKEEEDECLQTGVLKVMLLYMYTVLHSGGRGWTMVISKLLMSRVGDTTGQS